MVQGGATDTGYSEGFIENIVKYIREKPDLVSKLETLLQQHGFKKEGEVFNESTIKDVSELLMKDENLLKDAIEIVGKYFEHEKNFLEVFLEQANKVEGMEGKLETLGNQLSTQGIISAAAMATLTGMVAGLATIGGAAGLLMGGGIALAGLVALVAIAAIGYAIANPDKISPSTGRQNQ